MSQVFTKSTDELLEIIKKLNDLYTEHENYEYKTAYGTTTLLSNSFSPIYPLNGQYDYRNQKLRDYPLEEVWREFYKTEIKDFETLYQLYFFSKSKFLENGYLNYTKEMLGFNPNELIEKIEAEQKETNGLKYFDVNRKYSYSIGKISQVINILVNEYEDQDRDYSYKFGKMIFSYVYNNLNESELLRKEL